MESAMSIRKVRTAQRGFSLLELVIVMAVMMVVAAVAVPQIMRTMQVVRTRSSADEVAGLFQKVRMQAVKDNKFYSGIPQNVPGGVAIKWCLDADYSGTCGVAEYSVGLADYIVLAGAPPDTTLITCGANGPVNCPAGYAPGLSYVPEAAGVWPSYTARGLPCVNRNPGGAQPKWPADQCVQIDPVTTLPVGFLFVLNYNNTQNFAAIAVTPSGRVTTWTYTGIDGNGRAMWQQ